ncbi:MAG: hypothetical protein K6T26_05510 [Alicyclobacillus sp.]|nr:hypothetical protein [Alicyclobacillus sp.]
MGKAAPAAGSRWAAGSLLTLGVAAYLCADLALFGGPVSQQPVVGTKAAVPADATLDVPDTVVNQIAQATAVVPGVDELVVLPAAGGGYTVSAQVTLAAQAAGDEDWRPRAAADATHFFRAVYGAGPDVRNAQVYFFAGGRLVGGADLGKAAYQQLSLAVDTSPDAFVQAVQALPVRTGGGVDDSWLQLSPPEVLGG